MTGANDGGKPTIDMSHATVGQSTYFWPCSGRSGNFFGDLASSGLALIDSNTVRVLDPSVRETGERLFLSPNAIRSHARGLPQLRGCAPRTEVIGPRRRPRPAQAHPNHPCENPRCIPSARWKVQPSEAWLNGATD